MKNFIGTLLERQQFFLFIMCSVGVITGMEPFSLLKRSSAETVPHDKKIKVFDPVELNKQGIMWSSAIPNHVLITPDERGALIGNPGRVDYINFSNMIESPPYPLIAHAYAKYHTMFAVAQKGDVLKVVSIGNYRDKTTGKRMSERIICQSILLSQMVHNSHYSFSRKPTCERDTFDWPVQAMALNAAGTILVIAHGETIEMVDLETGIFRTNKFYPRMDKGIAVVDLAVRDNEYAAAVSSKGMFDIKQLAGSKQEPEFTHLRSVNSGDNDIIEAIYFLKNKDIFYATNAGVIKIIGATDWVENNQGNVRIRAFSSCGYCEKASIDQNLDDAAIHWTENENAPRENRLKIIVHREHGTTVQDFILSCDLLPRIYNYITDMLQDSSRRMHIMTAALRGSRVLALFPDGFVRLWKLPEKYMEPTEEYARAVHHPSRELPRNSSVPAMMKEEKKDKGKRSSLVTILKSTSKKIEESKKPDSEAAQSSPRGRKHDNRSASTSPNRSKRGSLGVPRHIKSDEPVRAGRLDGSAKNREESEEEYYKKLHRDISRDFTTL